MDKLQNIHWDGKSDPSIFINEYKDIQTTLTLLVKHYQEPHQSLQATALLKRIPDDKDLGSLLVIKENIKHNYDEDTLTVKIVEDKLQQWWAAHKDKPKYKRHGYYDRGRSKSPHYNKDKNHDKNKTASATAASTLSSKGGYKPRQYSKDRYRSRSNSRNRYNNNNGYRSRSNSYSRGKSPNKNKTKEESDSSSSESSGGEDNTTKQSANTNANKSQINSVSASTKENTSTSGSTQSDSKNTGATASFCNIVKQPNSTSSNSMCISAPTTSSKELNHENIYYIPKYNEALADSASAVMLTPRKDLLTNIKDMDNPLTITTLAGEKQSRMEGKMVLKNNVEFNRVKYLEKIPFTVLSIGQICNNDNYIGIFTKKGGYVVDSKIINEDEVSKKSVLKFEKKGTLYVTTIAEDKVDAKSKLNNKSSTKHPFSSSQSHSNTVTFDHDESDEKSNSQSDGNIVMKEYSPKSLQEY
jgi:hypothetical protein